MIPMTRTLLRGLAAAFVSGLVAFAAHAKSGWTEDYDAAKAQAKKEGKLVFIDFTGSDWCGWCIKLDKEILSKSEFKDFAKENLVLVEIDFPRKKSISASQKKANDALAKKYKIEGFPTLIVLDSNGKKVGELGYMEGGPAAMIAELKKLQKRS
jgi:protein disulfide-isomerase